MSKLRQVIGQMLVYQNTFSLDKINLYRTFDKNILHVLSASNYTLSLSLKTSWQPRSLSWCLFHFQNESPQGTIDKSAKDIVKGIQESKTKAEKRRQQTSRVDGRRMTIMENVAAKQQKATFTNLEKNFKKKFQEMSELTLLIFKLDFVYFILQTSSLISPSFQGDPTIVHKGIFLTQTSHIKN